jgi:membrane protein YdbS with pleckstrin-like domain
MTALRFPVRSDAVRPEPTNALPAPARTMWLVQSATVCLVLSIGALALARRDTVPLAAAVAFAIVALAYGLCMPVLRHRRWRWALGDQELDLVHGVWAVTRTIVPLTRIQHVSVQRTGWSDLFGLVALHVSTAAGTTTIPALTRPQGDELRDRILARLSAPDDL